MATKKAPMKPVKAVVIAVKPTKKPSKKTKSC